MVSRIRMWSVAFALAGFFFAGCSPQVSELDSLEFSHPVLRKARAKLREGDKPAALQLLNKAIAEKPSLAQAHLEAAQLYDDYDHDYVRALYHYERYLELRPQTEKRQMIEGFIYKAKIAFAASLAEQMPGLDTNALRDENERLKRDLKQVRANLAGCMAAPSPGAARPATGKPALPSLPADRAQFSGQAPVGPGSNTAVRGRAGGSFYTVKRGDTLSAVAARVYHNPRKWPVIYDANRDVLGNSRNVKVGQVLFIPE